MFLNVLLCKSKWIYSLINLPQNASLPKLRNPCRISPKPHEKCLMSVLQFHLLSLSIQQTINRNLPFLVLKRIFVLFFPEQEDQHKTTRVSREAVRVGLATSSSQCCLLLRDHAAILHLTLGKNWT